MRERIEDLGVLCEKLDLLCEDELFEWKSSSNIRDKDTADWFLSLDKEKQSDIIHSLAYKITNMSDKLHECFKIARWGMDEEC
jgi:hypothetical protein